VTLAGPSHDSGVPQNEVPPPPNPSGPAPVNGGTAGQHAYTAGPANAMPSHYPPEMTTPLDASNQAYRTPPSQGSRSLAHGAGPSFIPPLVGPNQIDSVHLCICRGDHWLVWCNLAWEHYNNSTNSPLPCIRLPCTCSPELLMMGKVPKSCPSVAGHLLTWVSYV